MSRFIHMTTLLSASVSITSFQGKGKDSHIKDEKICRVLSDGKYCFDEDLVYIDGRTGFLLRIPFGAMDHSCNLGRKLSEKEFVLFGDERMPSVEYPLDGIAAKGIARKLRNPEEHFFEYSAYEIETCKTKTAFPGTRCTVHARWRGMRLEANYWVGCGVRRDQFMRELEDLIEGARDAGNN